MIRRLAVAVVGASLFTLAVPAASPAATGTGSPNMRHVTTLAYKLRYGQEQPFGTDIEFARIKGRDYAFAGSYQNGLQIVDITNPARPRIAAVYDCSLAQGDVQVFRRGTRTLLTYTADDYPTRTLTTSRCYRDMGLRTVQYGTFIVDVTDPTHPVTLGFAPIAQGSHNQSVHPSGRYLYNSNSESAYPGRIEVVDIADPTKPHKVGQLTLDTGADSHDITFSADGTRAYSAALTHTVILDTSDPANPTVIGRILDPAVNIHHQAEPLTIDDPLLGRRTFLVVTDELAGAAGNGFCPGGGLHVYDITGGLERTPLKVGFWAIPDLRLAVDNLRCTSHVLRFYPERQLMTIAWYDAGVRVVDVSGLAGVSVGVDPAAGNVGAGMREIGYYTMPDADTWSAKVHRFERDGSFYLFGNDMHRGLDVYRFDARAPRSDDGGVWLSPAEALALARTRGVTAAGPAKSPYCLLAPLLS